MNLCFASLIVLISLICAVAEHSNVEWNKTDFDTYIPEEKQIRNRFYSYITGLVRRFVPIPIFHPNLPCGRQLCREFTTCVSNGNNPFHRQCQCLPGYVPNHRRVNACIRPCAVFSCGANTFCNDEVDGRRNCICHPGYIPEFQGSEATRGCIKRSCTDASFCGPHTFCSENDDGIEDCFCQMGFYAANFGDERTRTGCIPKQCTVDGVCGDNAFCVPDTDGKAMCYCDNDFYYDADTETCKPTPCTEDGVCGANAFCVPDTDGKAKCYCDNGFYYDKEDEKCNPICGDTTCHPTAECVNGNCQCPTGFVTVDDSAVLLVCRPGCGDTACHPTAERGVSGACQCPVGSIPVDGTGMDDTLLECCGKTTCSPTAECSDTGACQCPVGSIPVDGTGMDDTLLECCGDNTCDSTAECGVSGACQCRGELVPINDAADPLVCQPAPCDPVCTGDNAACNSGICGCIEGYVIIPGTMICRKDCSDVGNEETTATFVPVGTDQCVILDCTDAGKMDYNDANQYCMDQGSMLPTIPDEQSFIALRSFLLSLGEASCDVWVGLVDMNDASQKYDFGMPGSTDTRTEVELEYIWARNQPNGNNQNVFLGKSDLFLATLAQASKTSVGTLCVSTVP